MPNGEDLYKSLEEIQLSSGGQDFSSVKGKGLLIFYYIRHKHDLIAYSPVLPPFPYPTIVACIICLDR